MEQKNLCARVRALSFVACVSDSAILEANLLSSPCLNDGSPNESIVIRNCPSAADGLNIGIARAEAEWVVCVHQDVWLPAGWDRNVAEQLEDAERRLGPIGVAGVYGVGEVIAPRCVRVAGRRAHWLGR